MTERTYKIELYSQDGRFLSYTSKKRANWYLKRKLGEKIKKTLAKFKTKPNIQEIPKENDDE